MLNSPCHQKYCADVVLYFTAKTESRKDAQRYFGFSLRNFAPLRLGGEIPKTFGADNPRPRTHAFSSTHTSISTFTTHNLSIFQS
jgi:hypothetical protein